MRRRTLTRILAAFSTALLALLVLLAGMVLRTPASYRRATIADGQERRRLSGELQSTIFNLMPGNPLEVEWQETFTEEQINSYFAEDFLRAPPFSLPEGIHSPRVRIAPDRLELAFCYGEGFWSSVISVELNAWLVAGEPNTVAIEFLRARAGSAPISVRSVTDRLFPKSADSGLEVTWYRHHGHPVALVRINAEQHRAPFLLQRLELLQDRLVVGGRTSDDTKITSLTP